MSKINSMAAAPTTDPTTVPAVAPPLIDFGFTGTAVAELLVAKPVFEVELASPAEDVLTMEVVGRS